MDTHRANSDITANTTVSHPGMSDHHHRSFVGHHTMNGVPMIDHWPSPPMAHNHHMSNSSSNNNSSNTNASNNIINYNNNNSNNNMIGSCVQNQCNVNSDMDTSLVENNNNNNSSNLMKNGDCSVITANDNHKNCNSSSSSNNSNNNSSSDSASHSDVDTNSSSVRQNQVGTIVLHGVAIVSLIIDNKERLCLAQISNTLLKEYSYNEIHNRRVALGITCVQCTPVQLEILRRAGAMPVSSRRCGMITKREAERLVKSFLEDNDPPKLPEDFAFDVIHDCGWGCRGLFEPARYNSSRAKCIKCMYCSMYFSPNKFIFHFHRTPGAKYNHPDAANFNSWRRHLKLYQAAEKDEITFKWEDVKAMFNGGTRKRIGSSVSSSSSSTSPSSSMSSKFSPLLSSSSHSNQNSHHHHHHHQSTTNRSASYQQHSPSVLEGASSAKKAKTSSMVDTNSFLPKPAPFSNPFNPYGWLGANQNKTAAYPFMTMNSAQSMCFGFPPHIPANKDALMDRMKSAPVGVGNTSGWMNRNPVLPFQLASMDLLWDKTFGFPSAAAVAALGGFRNGSYPNSIFPGTNSHVGMDMNEHLSPPRDNNTPCMSPNPGMTQKLMSPGIHERGEKGGSRTSAFTRVVPSMSPPSSASLSPQNSNIDRNTPSRNGDDEEDDENDTNIQNDAHEEECHKMDSGQSISNSYEGAHRDLDDSEEIDVEDHCDDKKRLKCNNANTSQLQHHRDICHNQRCNTPQPLHDYSNQQGMSETAHTCQQQQPSSNYSTILSSTTGATRQLSLPSSPRSDGGHCDNQSNGRESALSAHSDTERECESSLPDVKKEESLREEAKTEYEDCKDNAEEIKSLKDHYTGVSRESTFQEHMSKQLEMLRETLTTELEQERKIRYSLQEKLKQAHDALNSFSCGLMSANGDPNAVPR